MIKGQAISVVHPKIASPNMARPGRYWFASKGGMYAVVIYSPKGYPSWEFVYGEQIKPARADVDMPAMPEWAR